MSGWLPSRSARKAVFYPTHYYVHKPKQFLFELFLGNLGLHFLNAVSSSSFVYFGLRLHYLISFYLRDESYVARSGTKL